MARLNCEDAQDRLELLALNALDVDERRAVEAHLEICPDCQSAFADVLQTVELLPEAAQSLDPVPPVPDRLKSQLFARLSATEASPPGPATSASDPRRGWLERLNPFSRQPRWRWAIAAINIIVLIGLGGLLYQQRTATEQLTSQVARLEAGIDILLDRGSGSRLFLEATSEAEAGSWGNVYTHRDSELAVVLVADTAPPPPDAEYHVWFRTEDKLVDAGIVQFSSDAGSTDHGWLIAQKPEAVQRVMVTLEPKGSPSPQPLGPTVLAANY